MRKHQELQVWQEAMVLVKQLYELTAGFPKEEIYALSNQIRRAAVSVPSNIAEGAARGGAKEFIHFLMVARGSLSELETQVLIARNLGYVEDTDEIAARLDKVFALIGGLIRNLQLRSVK